MKLAMPEMALAARFSYRRLRNEGGFFDDDDEERERVIRRARSSRSRVRKRFRVKIPSLRRFLRRRAGLAFVSWAKVLRRLKDSQSHFGDLFAGNYLFMQVTPTPLKSEKKSYLGHELQGLPSRYSLGKIA